MATTKSNSFKHNQKKFEQFQSCSLDKEQQKYLKGGNDGSGDDSGEEDDTSNIVIEEILNG